MLNRLLVVCAFLSVSFAAVADDADSAGTKAASFGYAAPMQEGTRTDRRLEGTLMGVLAAAAFGFQLRRKIRASTRSWQRIDLPSEDPISSAVVEGSSSTSAPHPIADSVFSTMRWQQMH